MLTQDWALDMFQHNISSPAECSKPATELEMHVRKISPHKFFLRIFILRVFSKKYLQISFFHF